MKTVAMQSKPNAKAYQNTRSVSWKMSGTK